MKQWKRERREKIGKISEEAKRIALRLSPWLAAKRIYNRGSFYWLAAAPSFSCPGFPSLSSHAGPPPPPPSLYRKWDSVSLLTFSRPSEDLTQRRAKLAATVVPWIVTEKERKPSCSLQAHHHGRQTDGTAGSAGRGHTCSDLQRWVQRDSSPFNLNASGTLLTTSFRQVLVNLNV